MHNDRLITGSSIGVAEAVSCDKWLRRLVLCAERTDIPGNFFDILVVQNGLYHLQSLAGGFREMRRIAKTTVLFFEPHDAIIARTLEIRREKNGEAVNNVSQWTRKLARECCLELPGPDSFNNLSFSFCHHNPLFLKLGRVLGGGFLGFNMLRFLKLSLDFLFAKSGNQFCGLVVKRSKLNT